MKILTLTLRRNITAFVAFSCILWIASGQIDAGSNAAHRKALSAHELLIYCYQNPSEYENIIGMCDAFKATNASDRALIHNLKAKAYYRNWMETKRLEVASLAEQHWRAAIEERPNDEGSRTSLAMLYFDQGRTDEGKALIAEIQRINPFSPRIEILTRYYETTERQQEMWLMEQRERAVALYRTKLDEISRQLSNGPSSALYVELADVLWKLHASGEQKSAREAIQAMAMDAKNVDAMCRIMVACIELGEYQSANDWALRATLYDRGKTYSNLTREISIKEHVIKRIQARIENQI